MADRKTSSPASPGVAGAIKDAIEAISKYVAPKSVTERKSRVDAAVDSATDYDRMRQGQSSDSNNY
jgi:hypothetical protein